MTKEKPQSGWPSAGWWWYV